MELTGAEIVVRCLQEEGVEHLFGYGGVTPQNVVPLVHGCIFTRGPKDLHRTAIFVGIIVGTLATIFIQAPLYALLRRGEEKIRANDARVLERRGAGEGVPVGADTVPA